MNSFLYHIQLNIDFKNISFYQDLMRFLGWEIIFSTDEVVGFHSNTTGDIWFVNCDSNEVQNYDAKGMNHLAIRVGNQENVDEIAHFLHKNDILPLFNTPRHRPEFAESEKETYYQVMFETVDKVLFEIVYIGKK